MTGLRGLIVGITYYYAFGVSIPYRVLSLGTAILELGAYVFSAAAGINVSAIFPRRHGTDSRWTAFKMVWKDAARLYAIVIILLALGAAWEIGGIYILMPQVGWRNVGYTQAKRFALALIRVIPF